MHVVLVGFCQKVLWRDYYGQQVEVHQVFFVGGVYPVAQLAQFGKARGYGFIAQKPSGNRWVVLETFYGGFGVAHKLSAGCHNLHTRAFAGCQPFFKFGGSAEVAE